MKTVLIGAAMMAAMASTAEAREPTAILWKDAPQKVFTLGAISVKPLAPAKVLQSWVLHNPYKPQTVKLAVLY